jgi:hypothetical protein
MEKDRQGSATACLPTKRDEAGVVSKGEVMVFAINLFSGITLLFMGMMFVFHGGNNETKILGNFIAIIGVFELLATVGVLK